ncbi:MAG: glycosyltransferase family 39 protein [Bdellovibrionota bacterium]
MDPVLKTASRAAAAENGLNRETSRLLFGVIAIGLLLRLLTLGYPALSDPSEARYAAIGQDMLQSGDWITPQTHVKGELVPFLGKPPLHAWLVAISYSLFGLNDFSARVPSFVATLFASGAAACFAYVLLDLQVAILALVFLGSAYVAFVLSASCLIDPLLGACIAWSFASFALAVEHPKPARRKTWGQVFFFTLGLGMLTKGPVAIVIAGIGIAVWLLLNRRLGRIWSELPWGSGIGVFLLTWVPWYAVAELHHPGFLKYFFINENLLRFLVKDYGDLYGSGHRYPHGTIWLMWLCAFLPWILLPAAVPSAVRRLMAGSPSTSPWFSYAMLWATAPCLLFMLARQISLPYVLPGLPGAALALALVARESFANSATPRLLTFFRLNVVVSTIASCLMLCFALFSGVGLKTVSFAAAVVVAAILVSSVLRHRIADKVWLQVALSGLANATALTVVLLAASGRLDAAISAKGPLEYVESLSPRPDAIAFLNRAPHSAFFYSKDVSPPIAVETVPAESVATTSVRFLAVQKKEVKQLSPEALAHFRTVKDFGLWVLFERVE